MAGLFDGIEEERIRKGPQCSVALLRAELEADDADQLDRVLALPKVATTEIVRRLRSAGHDIQPHPINRHRRGDCKCGRL